MYEQKKRNRRTNIFTILLAAIMVFTLLPQTSIFAADPTLVGRNIHEVFPDANFCNYVYTTVLGHTGTPAADYALTAADETEIETENDVECKNMSISDLTGIEYFIGAVFISCSGNQLTALDVSKNLKLKHLYCYSNKLTQLDTSMLDLGGLFCNDNEISSLKVKDVNVFHCQNNKIAHLDLTHCPSLHWFICTNNNLTSLDFSGKSNLVDFSEIETQSPGPVFYVDNGDGTYSVDLNQIKTILGDTGFDISKISLTDGGTLEGSIVKYNAKPAQVTYSYTTGGNVPTMTDVTLSVTGVPDPVIALTHGTDGNGSITEWMLKGDANRSADVDVDDAQFITDYNALNDPAYTFIRSDALAFESADVDGNANPDTNDAQHVFDLTRGAATLPGLNDSFRVIDAPNTGYKITSATIKTDGNADVILTPAAPTSGTYTLVIASDGTGTVTGQSLYGENNVYFIHELEANPVYTVVYDGNGSDGGIVPADSNAYNAGDAVTVARDVPTKTGCKFLCWKVNTEYQPGDTFSFDATHIALVDANRVLTLTAQWKVVTPGAPKTGDNGNVWLHVGLLMTAVPGMVILLLTSKGKRKKNI